MPTYVYKFVQTGETIEVQQAFTDDTLSEYIHPDTGESMPVKKVFQPVGVTFKGSGFFKTDNRGKAAATAATTGASSSDGSSSSSESSGSTASTSDSGSTSSSTSNATSTPGSSSSSSSSPPSSSD